MDKKELFDLTMVAFGSVMKRISFYSESTYDFDADKYACLLNCLTIVLLEVCKEVKE